MMNFANGEILHVLFLYAAIVLVPYFLFCHFQVKILSPWKLELGGKKKDGDHEIASTLSSLGVMYGTLILSGFLQDKNMVTFHSDLPKWYFYLSFPLIVVIHDAYFYWTHYLMHKSRFLYQFHKKHHLSSDATPLDVFAFHPVSAFTFLNVVK